MAEGRVWRGGGGRGTTSRGGDERGTPWMVHRGRPKWMMVGESFLKIVMVMVVVLVFVLVVVVVK